jgi:hypothetical protein
VNRNAGPMLTSLAAIAIFGLVAIQTLGALQASGAWSGTLGRKAVARVATAEDPFAPIGLLLSRSQPPLPPAGLRDPFTLGNAPTPASGRTPVAHRIVVPKPPPKPVLTAIVWDADPRAVVHWQGRDWTVHPGGLFDEFQVVSITRTDVTLSRGSERIVLQRRPQGE